MSKENEIEINKVVYVRKDSITKTEKAPSLKGKPLVLIRSYAAGVFYGYLNKKTATVAGIEVQLLNCKRIFQWYGACSLSQVATEGVKDKAQTKISVETPEQEIMNVIEIIPLSKESFENLNSVATWKK